MQQRFLAIETNRTQVFLNKRVYFGLSILEISKIVMYQFCYDYVKPKYGEKAKLYSYSFIVYIKTENIYVDIAKDVETITDTSNYELGKSLPKGRNKKIIGSMKSELSGKIMSESEALRSKTYSYRVTQKKNGHHQKSNNFRNFI